MGGPFTTQEIHQLAFGLPEQWLGIINRDRWRAHGAAVMEEWQRRVELEAVAAAEAALLRPGSELEARTRPEPWPVTFYGRPIQRG